jgi:rhodanese-related sulfurtransferase
VVRTISREEIEEKMDRGEDFVLIDTLAAMYYRHSHLPGAINLPVEEIESRAAELLPDKNAEIVVYCMDDPCPASERAARELAAMGYTNVGDYVGGKKDWLGAGLPGEGRHFERRRERNR